MTEKEIIIVGIAALIFILIATGHIPKNLFSITPITTDYYIPLFSSSTNLNDIGKISGSFRQGSADQQVNMYPDGTLNVNEGGGITFKQNFYGQNILVSGKGKGAAIYLSGQNVFGFGDYERQRNVILQPHTLDFTQVDVIVDGVLTQTFSVTNPTTLGINAGKGDYGGNAVNINFIGYQPAIECSDITPDKVPVAQTFGNDFSIRDLAFKPTNFCRSARPFTFRTEQGETAIYPDPIPDFNRGNIIKVASGQHVTAHYYAYYVTGLNNPCGINQENVFQNGQWVCQDYVKPNEILKQCSQDSDCPKPLSNLCPSYFVGCKQNKCAYDDNALNAPTCKNEVVTIIKQTQEVEKRTIVQPSGSNTFSFSQNSGRTSFKIGNALFTAIQPQFLCQMPSGSDYLNAPSPSPDCWKTRINYDGNSFDIKDSQTIALNNIISVQYFASGKLTNGAFLKPTDWGNNFYFTIDAAKAFQIQGTYGESALQNSDLHLKFNIVNNLPKGDATIRVRQQARATGQWLPEQTLSTTLNSGDNQIDIIVNSKNLGLNDVYVDVFYSIQADTLIPIPAGSISITYNIVTALPSTVSVQNINAQPIEAKTTQPTSFFSTIPTPVKVIGGIIIGLIILSRLL